MPNHQTIIRCSQTTAAILFITLGSLFTLAGCAGMYRILGMSDEQATVQVQKDQEIIIKTVETVRDTTNELIATALAGLGAIASGFLAKWLGTERKMTKALIIGVEGSDPETVKDNIRTQAVKAGVQKQLDHRVQALT